MTTGSLNNFYLWHPQVERGNRPTDWTPSSEDLVTQAELDTYLYEYSESEANSKHIPPGVYIGLRPSGAEGVNASTEAVINARGGFEVHQNQDKPVVASSIGIDRITLGNLVLYKTSSGSVAFDYDGTATDISKR